MSYFLQVKDNRNAGSMMAEIVERDAKGVDTVILSQWVATRAEAQTWFGKFLNATVPQVVTPAGRVYNPGDVNGETPRTERETPIARPVVVDDPEETERVRNEDADAEHAPTESEAMG